MNEAESKVLSAAVAYVEAGTSVTYGMHDDLVGSVKNWALTFRPNGFKINLTQESKASPTANDHVAAAASERAEPEASSTGELVNEAEVLHSASGKFKVGDRVRTTQSLPHKGRAQVGPGHAAKVVMILDSSVRWPYVIKLHEDDHEIAVAPNEIELVKDEAPKFKVGDRVKVLNRPSMSPISLERVGKTGVVFGNDYFAWPYGVDFDDGTKEYFRHQELELVEEDDNVNNPSHYKFPGGVEVIDITKHLDFPRGNAIKYAARAGRKDKATELEDLRKAEFYIKLAIEQVSK